MLDWQSCRDLAREALAQLGVAVVSMAQRAQQAHTSSRHRQPTERYDDYWTA